MRGKINPFGPPAPGLLDVNQPEYSTQLTSALGLQTRVPGKLDRNVSVGIQLDDYTAPEFWWLRRGIRGYAGDARGATAAQFAFFALQCQPGSLLVVEKVYLTSHTSQYLSIGIQAAQPAAAAAAAGTALDSRAQAQGGAARWVLSSNAAVTGPTVATRIYCAADAVVLYEPDAVITGGQWFSVISTTLNTEMAVSVVYRERTLLPSEE